MSTGLARINIDGAARGNPGPAAFGIVIAPEGQPPVEEACRIGIATNNVAEYTALVRALQRAAQLGLRRLVIHSDSELLVKQMNGAYRVKKPELQVLYEQAQELCRQFESVKIHHVRREQNSRADYLCNCALDGKSFVSKDPKPMDDPSTIASREILDCLRQAAQQWAQGDPARPCAETVWQRLRAILHQHGLLAES